MGRSRKRRRVEEEEGVEIELSAEEVKDLVIRALEDLEVAGVVKREGDRIAVNLNAIAAAVSKAVIHTVEAQSYRELRGQTTFNAAASVLTLGFILLIEEALNVHVEQPDALYVLGLWLASAEILRSIQEDYEGRKLYKRVVALTKLLKNL